MAGTANYTTDVLNSMNMKNPKEGSDFIKSLEDTSKNIQRYTTGGPIVGMNQFEKQAAQSNYLANEEARREAAAAGALGIAGKIDTRVSGAADSLAEAWNKAQNDRATTLQNQAQSLATTKQNELEALGAIDDKKRDIDWTLEKNQTTRDDAIENAYVKGIVDDVLLENAIAGDLKLLDLDQYYALKKNEINEAFRDWQSKTDIDWTKFLAEMVASSEAFAQLFGGAMMAVSAGAQYVFS